MNTEKESPFSNPRFLLVLAITFIALWGWQYYLNIKYPAAPAQLAIAANEPSVQPNPPASENISAKEVVKAAPGAAIQNFDYADENVNFSITSEGFGFKQFQLNTYKDHDGKPIEFVNDDAFFSLLQNGKPILFNMTVSADKKTYTGIAVVDGKEITRVLQYDPSKQAFSSNLKIPNDLTGINIQIVQNKIVPKSSNFLMPSFDHQDFVYLSEGKTHSERITGLKDTDTLSKPADNVTMASVGSQYFVAAIVNKSDVNPKIQNKVEGKKATLTIEHDLKNVKVSELNHIIYVGPKKTELLQTNDASLPEVLNYGMFGFISKILLSMMKFIYSFVGNWGVAIIVLTIVVRAILLPFNVMSFKSAQAMQKIKPQMDSIKERYKKDPVRMNKETMALMKENNANPLSGCLPMLLQIPIFFAFFATISTSIELYHQPFMGWIKDLSSYDPFFVLPILMGITMYFQQKMMPTTMDPMQAKILNFMPIIFTLFMVTLPSGLTLYNFISALFGVVQQYFLLRDTRQAQAQKA